MNQGSSRWNRATKTSAVFSLLLLAILPGVGAELPPGTYQGYYESLQGTTSPPVQPDFYDSVSPYVGATMGTGALVLGASGEARFNLDTAVDSAGSWSVQVTVGNTFTNCVSGTFGGRFMARTAANADLVGAQITRACPGTPTTFTVLPGSLGTSCNGPTTGTGTIVITWDTVIDTVYFTAPGISCSIALSPNQLDLVGDIGFPPDVHSASNQGVYDDLIWNPDANGDGDLDGPTFIIDESSTPTAPTGVSAVVITAQGGGGSNTELRWPLSSNDPNQDTGDFSYSVLLNGVVVQTDSLTAADGDGFRTATVNFANPEGASTLAFSIRAKNLVSQNTGPASCSASVNDGAVGNRGNCGSLFAGGSGATGAAQDPDTPLGQMVDVISTAWGFDWSWIIGAILLAVCLVGVLQATHGNPLAGSAVVVIVAVANIKMGLWEEWSLLIMVLIIAAIVGNRLFQNRDGEESA